MGNKKHAGKGKEHKEGEIGYYGKVARYGDLRIRYRNPIIILSQSAKKAEDFFALRAKSLPGKWGLGGSFEEKLYWFSTSEEAEQFFSSQGFDNIIFE